MTSYFDFSPSRSGERHESLPLWILAGAWEVDGQLADADPCWFLLFSVSQTLSAILLPGIQVLKESLFLLLPLQQEPKQRQGLRISSLLLPPLPPPTHINNNWNMSIFCDRCSYFYEVDERTEGSEQKSLKGRAWKYGQIYTTDTIQQQQQQRHSVRQWFSIFFIVSFRAINLFFFSLNSTLCRTPE